MRKVKVTTVMIDRPKTSSSGQVFFNERNEVVTEDVPLSTGAILDELVWADEQFSSSAGAAGCFERWAEKLGEAKTGDEFEMAEEDHELISKKLKEWSPKDQSGRKQGSKNSRRIRLVVNAFIFSPQVEARPPASA